MKRQSKSVRGAKILGLLFLGVLVFKFGSYVTGRSPPVPYVRGASPTASTVGQFTVEIKVKNKGDHARCHSSRMGHHSEQTAFVCWVCLNCPNDLVAVNVGVVVEAGYYTNSPLFRVIRGFMAQFGIADDPKVSKSWEGSRIKDDPQVSGVSNHRGYISFANSGPNTRTAQLFINFGDNHFLDRQHFAPIGKVVDEDLDVLNKIHVTGEGAPRGRGPNQAHLYARGGEYIRKHFPQVDWIESIQVIS